MRYLFAFILPPLAVLLSGGRFFTAILNLVLCFFFWFPGIIHALIVVSSHKADVRSKKQIHAIKLQTATLQSQTNSQLSQRQAIAAAQLEQNQQIASAQLRCVVESAAAISASNLAGSTATKTTPPQLPAALNTSYKVARSGDILGEYNWTQIQEYLHHGNLIATDHYYNGTEWIRLG